MMAPDIAGPNKRSRLLLTAERWLVVAGALFLVGFLASPNGSHWSYLALASLDIAAAYLLSKDRRVGALLAGCALALLVVMTAKQSFSASDLAIGIGAALVLGGVPFLLALFAWRWLR